MSNEVSGKPVASGTKQLVVSLLPIVLTPGGLYVSYTWISPLLPKVQTYKGAYASGWPAFIFMILMFVMLIANVLSANILSQEQKRANSGRTSSPLKVALVLTYLAIVLNGLVGCVTFLGAVAPAL